MTVDAKSEQAKLNEDDLKLVWSLWGGTKSMREAGRDYLPQEEGEKNKAYDDRRKRSFLTNFFKKTIKGLSGRVAEDEIKVVDDESAEALAENIDMQGRDLHRFAYSLAEKTIRDGLRYILVDAPSSEGVETLADEMVLNIRPYWVEVDRRQVLGWKDEGGKLTQFRMKESVTEDEDEFTEKTIEQIRVIEAGTVRLYRKDAKGDWQLHDTIETSYDFIPVVPVYARQENFMQAEPPLMDVADLNVEHWQKSSDQSNILHVARVPILFGSGIKAPPGENGEQKSITISPNSFTNTPDKGATLQYVEHSGAAIGAGREDLIDIENRARAIGADFIVDKPGNVTATQRVLEEAGNNSELAAFGLNLKDSLEMAFDYSAMLQGEEFTGEVIVNTSYGVNSSTLTPEDLLKMRAAREISQETYLRLLNEVTGFEVDAEKEQEKISDEGVDLPPIDDGNPDRAI